MAAVCKVQIPGFGGEAGGWHTQPNLTEELSYVATSCILMLGRFRLCVVSSGPGALSSPLYPASTLIHLNKEDVSLCMISELLVDLFAL